MMETADWLDFMAAAMENGTTYYALFFTVVSGYLVVAYTVGKNLLRNQVTFVNFLFIVSTFMASTGVITAFRDGMIAYRKGADKIEEMTAISAGLETVYLTAVVGLNILIVLGCLKFMWDVRHPKAE
jgi:hypothetical protein